MELCEQWPFGDDSVRDRSTLSHSHNSETQTLQLEIAPSCMNRKCPHF